MKKIIFCLVPLLLTLGMFSSPLLAKSSFSFSVNLNAMPCFAPRPIVREHIVVARPALPPPPIYVQKKQVIHHYYYPTYQEDVFTIQPYPYPICP